MYYANHQTLEEGDAQAMMTLKERIAAVRETINELQEKEYALCKQCADAGHFIEKKDDSAVCDTCGKDMGWWCPNSPNHYCDYSVGECCNYCNEPEERK